MNSDSSLTLAVLDLRVAVRVAVLALLGAGLLVHDVPRHRRHARDARLGEQSLVLLEPSVSPVRSTNIGFSRGQITVPAPDYVPILVRVLKVAPLEGVDLPLEVAERV